MRRLLAPLLRFQFRVLDWLVTRFSPATQDCESLLKSYLLLDQRTRQLAFSKYGIPAFMGIHPKNVFNFRAPFFLERVGAEDVVLDLACGSGALIKSLAAKIRKGMGVERDRSNLALCRNVCPANVEFVEGDILNLDYPELQRRSGYTTVIVSHILEHLKNPVDLLQRIQAPRVLVCVPSQENWVAQLKIHYGLPYLTDPTHFREYTRTLLREQLEEAGYIVRELGFNAEGEIVAEGRRT